MRQVCENLLEKMSQQSNSDGKLDLLTPFLSRLGQESAFPFMRLILPEVLQNAYRDTRPLPPPQTYLLSTADMSGDFL